MALAASDFGAGYEHIGGIARTKRGMAAAGQCATCHSAKGEGDPEKGIPDLRGQPPGYLQHQMLILREDKRKLDDPAMDELKKKVLKGLSEQDFADLAAYYSSLK